MTEPKSEPAPTVPPSAPADVRGVGQPRLFLLSAASLAGLATAALPSAHANGVIERYGFILLVLAAAATFTIGGAFMKLSDGLTRAWPTIALIAFFVVGACLQALAMRGEDMAVTYIVVLGVEAILAFLLGITLFGEAVSPMKVIGVTAVVIGIAALRH